VTISSRLYTGIIGGFDMKRLTEFAKRSSRRGILVLALIFSLTATLRMSAQVVGGTILGTISD